MDLQTLEARAGIGRRKLRYCLDHGLIPGLEIEIADDRAGRPRKFAEDVGFGIVCAAKLLELGLPHERIRGFLKGLLEIPAPGSPPAELALVAAFRRPIPARAFLGDGINVRLMFGEKPYLFDSGWFAPGNPAKLATDYQPVTEVMLDLGQIRDQVRGSG